jgi:hypothetical protein
MSRSNKKNPYLTQGEGGKYRKTAKRYANKAIRNKAATEEVGSGAKFKREFSSWDICDWKFKSNDPKAKRK